MKRALLILSAISLAACEGVVDSTGTGNLESDLASEPPMAGIHWSRDNAGAHSGGGGGSPDLIYHGGTVMTTGAAVSAIFWGPSWADASFVGDKITGIGSFYSGLGGSSYEATNTEYTDSSGGHVGTAISYQGYQIDTSPAAKNGNRTGPILAEVCARISNPVPNGYYPVYVDQPRGHAGFCAWHSTGTCNGVQIQFAFFFNLDGDAGCDPQDTSGLHSQGLAALANVSGHEISETLTDQHLDAWTDSSGSENADKCAWSFGTPLLSFKNNTKWRVQGNWSNRAFDAGTGYANRSNQNGCIDGGNYK